MIPQGNRARFAGLLAAAAAVLALAAFPGLASAHHGHEGLGDAGTIESFDPDSGVLTIALAGGGTVSGLVTPRTHVHCDNGWHRGRHGLRHPVSHGRATASHDRGDAGEDSRHGVDDLGDDPPGRDGTPPGRSEDPGRGFRHSDRCTTDDLTAGATVKLAVLTLVDGEAVYAVVGLPKPEDEDDSPDDS